jgi:hypothetical protein
MSAGIRLTGLLLAGTLCLPAAGRADTLPPHRTHKVKKQELPPLPSGTQGPVPQVPLDAIPAVAPQVSYQDGLLTIVAPNSTLGDILRGVRKHTSADIEIPPTASERVVTRLGPGPAREVLSELLNGSRFNYILLGSPQDANALVRVVLVAKAVETPATATPGAAAPAPGVTNAPSEAAEEPQDEPVEEPVDQGAVDAEQAAGQQPEQPPVKTPQQMLQEMQQRQLQMQQQQQSGQAGQGVQPGPYPMPPGIPRPPQQQQPPDNE